MFWITSLILMTSSFIFFHMTFRDDSHSSENSSFLHNYAIIFLSSFFVMGKGINILGQVTHVIAIVTICHHVIDRKIDNFFFLKICTYSISLEREIFCEFNFRNHIFLSRDLSYFYCQLCQQ